MTSPSDDWRDRLYKEWLDAVQGAYRHAYAVRMGQLRGAYIPRQDSRGIETYSHEWGVIMACEVLEPWLRELRTHAEPYVEPTTLRRIAQEDAERRFAHEIIEGARLA